MTGVNGVDEDYTNTLGIRLSIDGSFSQADIDITSENISLVDSYGNTALVTTIDVF